ncbi:MAG TPA: hypothetical protein VKP03_02355 [Patescibacteria group bacterium]|nr:hypothetical protein [Patescibacteria group bacterium]
MKFNLRDNRISRISENGKVILGLILLAFLANMTVPRTVKAEPLLAKPVKRQEAILKNFNNSGEEDLLRGKFQEYDEYKKNKLTDNALKSFTVVATAYSSTIAQTDSTPCITADGFNVCRHNKEDIIAANFLPLGAKIMIPDLYGDKIFIVHDRMNPRYNYRIDLWKTDRNRAITFGKRLVKIKIVEY